MSGMTKNTVGELIITVGQNVRRNKHSISQKTMTFTGFLNVNKPAQKLKKRRFHNSQIIMGCFNELNFII